MSQNNSIDSVVKGEYATDKDDDFCVKKYCYFIEE